MTDRAAPTILVALDGWPAGGGALAAAATLAGATGSRLVLLRVAPVRGSAARTTGAERDAAEPALSSVADDLRRAGLQVVVGAAHTGEPAGCVGRDAALWDADVVVAAAGGRSAIERPRHRSEGAGVARGCRAPVLLVPDAAVANAPLGGDAVLAAVDGSAADEPVLRGAVWLAQALARPVLVIHPVWWSPTAPADRPPSRGAFAALVGQAAARAESLAAAARRAAVRARGNAFVGSPGRTVAYCAAACDAAAVVAADRPRGARAPGVASLVDELLARSSRPLLVVSRP